MPRIGRARSIARNVDRTFGPLGAIPDRSPEQPVFQRLQFGRHPVKLRPDELWGGLGACLRVGSVCRVAAEVRLGCYRGGKKPGFSDLLRIYRGGNTLGLSDGRINTASAGLGPNCSPGRYITIPALRAPLSIGGLT